MTSGGIPVVVLGAGPAGLAAAWQLARRGRFAVTLVERGSVVGGNAGSFTLEGQPVDYGSHRLHPACPPAILADIRQMLGGDLLLRPRHGRIRLRQRWVHFPLKPLDVARHMPPGFLLGVARDALVGRRTDAGADTFADSLEARLGPTVCREFYFPYVRKIWGVAPDALDAEQARRRVSVASLAGLLRKVLRRSSTAGGTGFGQFYYPRRGFGQISEAYLARAREAGVEVLLDTSVTAVQAVNGRVRGVSTLRGEREAREWPAEIVISTIPLPALAGALSPRPADEAAAACGSLVYRAMLLVYVVIECPQFTEYDAHYLPEPGVPFTRMSEPKNYSLDGPAGRTVLCAELPCDRGDAYWQMPDEALGRLLLETLERIGAPVRAPVRAVVVRRLSHAYPIYRRGYRAAFDRVDRIVGSVDGLVTIGRQGLFAHDNTHHTLSMAYAASAVVTDTGRVDRDRWAEHRRDFETHVVED